jgi:hypothetical protein
MPGANETPTQIPAPPAQAPPAPTQFHVGSQIEKCVTRVNHFASQKIPVGTTRVQSFIAREGEVECLLGPPFHSLRVIAVRISERMHPQTQQVRQMLRAASHLIGDFVIAEGSQIGVSMSVGAKFETLRGPPPYLLLRHAGKCRAEILPAPCIRSADLAGHDKDCGMETVACQNRQGVLRTIGVGIVKSEHHRLVGQFLPIAAPGQPVRRPNPRIAVPLEPANMLLERFDGDGQGRVGSWPKGTNVVIKNHGNKHVALAFEGFHRPTSTAVLHTRATD